MKKCAKKQLRNGYGYFLIDIEITKLLQKIMFDESDDPVGFGGCFKRRMDIGG